MGLPINSFGGRAKVGGWERGNHVLAPCSMTANHRQTASLIKMRINPLLKYFTFGLQPPLEAFGEERYSICKISRLLVSDLAERAFWHLSRREGK